MKTIESIQNKTIKEIHKLALKKERDKTSLFLVEGKHMVEEAFHAHCLKELYLLIGEENPIEMEPIYCTQSVLNKVSNQNSNTKMIGVCRKPVFTNIQNKKVLLLDQVQDPGNMGTILRTAYSFGIDVIYTSKGCADLYNSKTIQSSQGSLFHIPVLSVDLKKKIQQLQNEGTSVFATALHENSKSLQDIQIPESYGILLGNEGQGVSKELINLSNCCIKIEMKQFESLNVAIAAAICMYEFQYRKEV